MQENCYFCQDRRAVCSASIRTDAEVTRLTDLLSAIPLKHLSLIAIMLLFACPLYGKRKDDVVTMKNGDKFKEEIKACSMES